MRLLVDTHALLWWLADDPELGDGAREAIGAAEQPLFSAGTLLEASIKASLGKLALPDEWTDTLFDEGFGLLGILPAHAMSLGGLPFIEVGGRAVRDPFDRLLVAQATVERIPIVTRDPAIAAHGVPTLW